MNGSVDSFREAIVYIYSMLSFLSKEYSAPKGDSRELIISLLFGVFIGSFLVFFEPFDLSDARYHNRAWSIFFFGVISSSILIALLYLCPRLFPNIFNDKYWKVWHQLLLLTVALFFIATLNGLYINYLENLPFSWSNYHWIVVRTFVLGSIPICLIVLVDYNRKLQRHLQFANKIAAVPHPHIMEEASNQEAIKVMDNNQTIYVRPNDILYIEAEGNYVNLVTSKDEGIRKEMVRTSLSATEEAIQVSYIKRCHRSYIVNLRKVIQVTGNAQGLRLRLADNNQIVPVSRKYIPVIRGYFSSK